MQRDGAQLTMTHTGWTTEDPLGPELRERYIFYSSVEHPEFILASKLDVDILRQPDCVIGDGTFAFSHKLYHRHLELQYLSEFLFSQSGIIPVWPKSSMCTIRSFATWNCSIHQNFCLVCHLELQYSSECAKIFCAPLKRNCLPPKR